MKKWIALLLAAVFVLALIGCGSKQEKDKAEPESQQTEQNTPSQTAETPEPATEPDAVTPTAPAAQEPEPTPEATPEPEPEATEEPTPEPASEPVSNLTTSINLLGETVSLTKVGKVDASVIKSARLESDGMYVRTDDGKYILLDAYGNNALGESYDYIKSFINGTWIVYQNDKGINGCGLVKADGTVLIPVSAAIIDTIHNSQRFLEITYATEEVSDQRDAFLYSTSSWISISPDEGDKLYAGYALYYDLVKECFVGDLKRTSAGEAGDVDEVGDKLLFTERDTIYDENGNVFADFKGYSMNNMFIERGNDKKYVIYDSNLQEIAAFDADPRRIYKDGQLIYFYDYDTKTGFLKDSSGNQIDMLPFRYTPDLYESFLYGADENGYYLVMDLDGRAIITAEDCVKSVFPRACGFMSLKYENGEYGLVYPDGTIIKGMEIDGLLLSNDIERSKDKEILVLEQKNFTVTAQNGYADMPDSSSAPYFAVVYMNNRPTLLNIFTGETLFISEEYSLSQAFKYSNGHLYVLMGDEYVIYRIDVNG